MIDYSIEIYLSSEGIWSEIATEVTSTSHTETGLTEGTSYFVRVRVRNSIGFSESN